MGEFVPVLIRDEVDFVVIIIVVSLFVSLLVEDLMAMRERRKQNRRER